MGKIIDLTGKVYGRLTVISFSRKCNVGHTTYWDCLCLCGNKCIVAANNLKRGHTKSCGCFRAENHINITTQHGEACNHKQTKEYATWVRMKNRCQNVNNKAYYRYGGRGIFVCDRWSSSYENFLADMGRAPSSKHSIERIKNDKGYSPENCKWATALEQGNNKRNNRMIEYNGEIKSISMWCRELGLNMKATHHRIFNKNWPIDKAFQLQ